MNISKLFFSISISIIFYSILLQSEDAEQADKTREEYEKVRNLKKLFEGLKVFLSREVPRETLVFVLRCFGAQVSWEETSFPDGRLFPEDDESITHQIVDRPKMNKQFISRFAIRSILKKKCIS